MQQMVDRFPDETFLGDIRNLIRPTKNAQYINFSQSNNFCQVC